MARQMSLLAMLLGLAGTAMALSQLLTFSPSASKRLEPLSIGTHIAGQSIQTQVPFTVPVDDVIDSVFTSCGCTVIAMELPRTVVAGEKVPITLKIHTPKPTDDFRVLVQLRMQSGARHNFTLQGKIVPKPQP
jgi:hypothetical protein